jgi:hypothetical protein
MSMMRRFARRRTIASLLLNLSENSARHAARAE